MSTRPGSRSSATDRLTCMRSGSTVGSVSASCQRRAWRQASRRTWRPSGTISPVSSASGTNSAGGTRPRDRVLPAHERLGGDDPARVQRDDRLVLDDHLLALDRLRQLLLEVVAAQDRRRPSAARRARSAPCPWTWPGTWRRRRCGSARRSRRRSARSTPGRRRGARRPARCRPRRAARRPSGSGARPARPSTSGSSTPGIITANSSPPRRATVSSGRTQPRRRSATEISSASPTWWPSESLTVLKSSTSMNRTAIGARRPSSRARAP